MKIFNRLILSLFLVAMPMIAFGSLSGKKICLDPGHGGKDPGAPGVDGNAIPNESDMVLDIDKKFKVHLDADGANVIMTRSSDVYISLANRVAKANSNNVDIFLSTHLNSAESSAANGTETYATSSVGKSAILAKYVQEELLDKMGLYDRKVKYYGFYVIKYTSMPAILSEGAFLSNQGDFDFIKQSENREKHAVALYNAVCKYYGTTPNSGGATPPPTGTGNIKGFVYKQGFDNVEANRISDVAIVAKDITSGDEITTVSASTGLFKFEGLDSGDYKLTFSKEGFESAEKVVTVATGDSWASTPLKEISTEPVGSLSGYIFNNSNGNGNVDGNRLSGVLCVLKKK